MSEPCPITQAASPRFPRPQAHDGPCRALALGNLGDAACVIESAHLMKRRRVTSSGLLISNTDFDQGRTCHKYEIMVRKIERLPAKLGYGGLGVCHLQHVRVDRAIGVPTKRVCVDKGIE